MPIARTTCRFRTACTLLATAAATCALTGAPCAISASPAEVGGGVAFAQPTAAEPAALGPEAAGPAAVVRAAAAEADPAVTTIVPAPRPRIGLVLSGGGARGAAHIGVLKVLEQLHVPVDAIAGTSMGAVVGSLYAAGMSAGEIETLTDSLDWQDAFRDRPRRAELKFRRKQDDREFLVHLPLGLRGGHLRLPKGLIQGQKLNQVLRNALLRVADIDDFDRLPIPFRAIATDLGSGAPVVFARGSLPAAVRASMAAPGVFAPVEIDGRPLADGGLAANLPVEAVQALGVDVVIAVDVSAPLQTVAELDSALAVSAQMVTILINRETARSAALLGAQDLLLTPELGSMSSVEFAGVRTAIAAGEAAARGATGWLAQHAIPASEFARLAAARSLRPAPARIDFVRVADDTSRYRSFIEAALAPLVGQLAEPATLDPAMRSLYGRDLFETLDYRLVHEAERTGLEVDARRRSWGPTYLRFGLDLQDDFQGNDSFTAGVRIIGTEVNAYMAEWTADLALGERPKFAAEFYQPLDYASPWFVAPRISFGSRSVQVQGNGRLLAKYRVREADFELDAGREIGDWGELRAGVRRLSGNTHLQVGTPGPALPPGGKYQQGGYFARLSVDLLDSVNFPRHGEFFQLEWDAQRAALGAGHVGDSVRMDWLAARSLGRNTLVFSTSGGSSLTASQGVQNLFTVGGFLNLSGLGADSLSGPHFGVARLVYLRRIGAGGQGLFDVPTYLGASLEAGNVWQQRGDASFGGTHKDGALFVGIDSLLGPLYLGAGYDTNGTTSYYLFLGRTF